MRRFVLGLVLALGIAGSTARGAVVVLTNFTPGDLTVTITEPERKPQTVTLSPAQVAPVTVTGPADITFPTKPGPTTTYRLDVYHGYVFLPDPKTGLRLEGIELPGTPPFGDSRPEAKAPPSGPIKIPVTLLVDDADPRADALWQATLRQRFDAAAAVVEAHSGVKFEFNGFATWQSDPRLRDVEGLLADFEGKVKPKRGELVIGYTSRRVDEKPKEPAPFGACRGFPPSHILLRELRPRADPERIEVLIHHMGLALGATLTSDQGSVMREKVADGLALIPQYRYRFDPLNVLAMTIWADELRRGPVASVPDISPTNRIRLSRVYKALLKAHPGDSFALTYLNEFDRDQARAPEPKKEQGKPAPKDVGPAPRKDLPRNGSPRDDVARAVVRAVTARARVNVGPDALAGDDLTAAYIRAAADAALRVEGVPAESPDRVAGFLVGLAVALDDTDSLRNDVLTEPATTTVESATDREIRLSVLGNPTIRGRRDFCRRFVLGCGVGELLPPARAEDVAINRSLSVAATQKPTGVSLPALAAEYGGIAFARAMREDLDSLRRYADKATPAAYLPPTGGLRDGLPFDRFEEEYGDAEDTRFQAVLKEIRTRVKAIGGRGP
jgi:hypothetical protein